MAEKKLYKVPCSRCLDDKGVIKAFRHIQNGVCFKCNGLGYSLVKTNPEVLKRAKDRRDAKREAEQKDRMEKGQARDIANARKYKDDSRLGPETKASCSNSEAYAFLTYDLLEGMDKGTVTIEKQPWIFENLSK